MFARLIPTFSCAVLFAFSPPGSAQDQPPIAYDLAFSTARDVPLSITLRGDDPEGFLVFYFITQPPEYGTLTNNFVGDPVDMEYADLVYDPHPDFRGDSFRYVAYDGTSMSEEATVTIDVENTGPYVFAGFDRKAIGDHPVWLDGSAMDDGLPDPPAFLSVLWEPISGPGEVWFDDPLQPSTFATFSEAGEYVLALSADDGEYRSESQVTITALTSTGSSPPRVDIVASRRTGYLPFTVNLYATVELEEGRSIASYAWDFGDGTGSEEAEPAHAYERPGTFSLCLRVTDSAGESGVDVVEIQVFSLFTFLRLETMPPSSSSLTHNNDDDNDNSIPDHEDLGFVADEDELGLLRLSFPTGLEWGEIRLHAEGAPEDGEIRLFIDPNRSEELPLIPIGGGVRERTWQLEYESPPTTLYAEASQPGLVTSLGIRFGLTVTRGLFVVSSALQVKPNARPETAEPEPYDYVAPMRAVARRFGVPNRIVLHVGDSLTVSRWYAPLYTGKTREEREFLTQSHYGGAAARDGWAICKREDNQTSAKGGIRAAQILTGVANPPPPIQSLDNILNLYEPQIVVYMLGSNDNRPANPTAAELAAFKRSVKDAMELILSKNAIPILSTIPPFIGGDPIDVARFQTAKQLNEKILEVARELRIPQIPLWEEMIERHVAAGGTIGDPPTAAQLRALRSRYFENDGIHLNARPWGSSLLTERNVSLNGYMLRSWLTVQKCIKVRDRVLVPEGKW